VNEAGTLLGAGLVLSTHLLMPSDCWLLAVSCELLAIPSNH
jgi:hypothetical protein